MMDPATAGELAELVASHDHHRHPRLFAQASAEAVARRWVWNQEQEEQLAAVQADWENALARVLGQWQGITAAQRAEVLDQVLERVEHDEVEALAQMAVSTRDGAELLSTAMRELAEKAAQRMVEEAASQGVALAPVTGDEVVLDRIAATLASLLGHGTTLSAGREGLRVWGPRSSPAQVTRLVQEHLEGLSTSTLEALVGGALSNAQNRARIATLQAAQEDPAIPEAAYYANETLDGNTCKPCRAVDGRWLGNSLLEVERSYPNGGYIGCLGRERCRGTVVAVFRPETTGT